MNLYPFEATIARPAPTLDDAIENIDIGGPTLIRAAAKNHEHVAVAHRPRPVRGPDRLDPSDPGGTTLDDRRRLARAAFRRTAAYDRAVSAYLDRAFISADRGRPTPFPADAWSSASRSGPRCATARTRTSGPRSTSSRPRAGRTWPPPTVRHGKELSYNNLLDLDSALRLIRQFAEPAACILKHNNPCGAAISEDPATAFERAYEGDPVSAFGGIVALNRPVDRATAERMAAPGRFLEAILAPGFDDDALEWLTTKPTWRNSVRLIDLGSPIGPDDPVASGFDLRRIEGGLLVQDWDRLEPDPASGNGRDPPRTRPTPSGRTWPSPGGSSPR